METTHPSFLKFVLWRMIWVIFSNFCLALIRGAAILYNWLASVKEPQILGFETSLRLENSGPIRSLSQTKDPLSLRDSGSSSILCPSQVLKHLITEWETSSSMYEFINSADDLSCGSRVLPWWAQPSAKCSQCFFWESAQNQRKRSAESSKLAENRMEELGRATGQSCLPLDGTDR